MANIKIRKGDIFSLSCKRTNEAGASTIAIDFAVSGTTASFICRQATIQKVK